MKNLFLSEKAGDFNLLAYIENEENIRLRISHISAGKHFAEHFKVQILNKNLDVIGVEDINKNNIQIIFKNIKKKGTTEGLFVVKENGEYLDNIFTEKKNKSRFCSSQKNLF